MQLWVLFASILHAIETRHFYPYQSYHGYHHPQAAATTVQPSYLHRSVNDVGVVQRFDPYSKHHTGYHPHVITTTTPPPHRRRSNNDVTVVDEKTGIQYNPYSKHHPGRHVCTTYRNISHPVRTKRVFCKPTYKKYMVRCGTQWCEGVRLVYEKYHKEMVDANNHTVLDYSCCPGWTQVNWRSHGCNKPVCSKMCLNGGKCSKPDYCTCPQGYGGTYCEAKNSVYKPAPACSPSCDNGGSCNSNKSVCMCAPGYEGTYCERDIDECITNKPCDQICYNTPGSYTCECKENFALQRDGQTCRQENNDAGLEARDLENQEKLESMDRRIQKLEKMMLDKDKDQVTKKDIDTIYNHIDKIGTDISNISNKLQMLDDLGKSMSQIWSNIRLSSEQNLLQAKDSNQAKNKKNSFTRFVNKLTNKNCGASDCPAQHVSQIGSNRNSSSSLKSCPKSNQVLICTNSKSNPFESEFNNNACDHSQCPKFQDCNTCNRGGEFQS